MTDTVVMKRVGKDAFNMEDFEDMTLDEFKEWAEEMVADWPDPGATLDLTDHYEGGYTGADWKWDAPETDEERNKRLARDLTNAQEREQGERRILAALKAKYEP